MNFKLNKFWTRIFFIVAGLYALFLISPVIVSPIIDSYSDEIEDSLKTLTGFDVDLDDISFITAPDLSLGLRAKNFTLTIPSAGEPFFHSENAGIRVALLPLIIKKVQLSSISAKELSAELTVKKDGNFLIQDYIPKSDKSTAVIEGLPFGLKLSNHLPNIKIKKYKLGFVDALTSEKYYTEGQNFKLTDFILDKKFNLSADGKIIFGESVISNYNLKISNKIMPDLQLDDLIFPKDIVIENEEDTVKVQKSETFNIIDLFKSIKNNQLSADITANVKTFGTLKNHKINGLLKLDALSVAVDGKKLPESYLTFGFKGNRTDIDSVFFSSSDTNEKTQIIGDIHSGAKPSIDLTLRSNAKFNNIINLIDSIAESFNIDEFKTLSATGGIDADFNINSDLKKVTSTGYLKIVPSSISYGLYNIAIDNIVADVDLTNNNIDIKKAGFSVLGHPLKLSGTILSDASTDVKVTADRLSLKGLLAAFGQIALLKENDVKSGDVSLNAVFKGKLNKIKPEISSNINDIEIFNKAFDVKISLAAALVKILYDGKAATGDVDISTLAFTHPSGIISVPKTKILIDEKNIKIKNSYLMLNDSKIDIKGSINDYISDKMNINISAGGNIESSDFISVLPDNFRSLVACKGKLPLTLDISGNSKVQNVKLNLSADSNNYVSLMDIDLLKGQNTKIHSNIEIIGDSLTLSNTGISNDKTTIAKISGGVSGLYSSPKLNLNIAVPMPVSFPIWGIASSNITASGSVALVDYISNPKLRGTVNLIDLSIKDMNFAISDLVADLSGSILNGSATARQFKFGGIIANDISADFSLKDCSKFYLSDLTASAFDGKINGKVSYDIPTTKLGMELNGSGLNSTKTINGAVGIKNALTGNLDFNAKLAAQGLTDKDIIQSMKGNIDFNIGEGRFVGIGKIENLVAAQNISSNSILKSAISALSTFSTIQETDKYKYVKGEMNLLNGIANISKITVSGPLMAYYVHGAYNIIPNTANLIILGRLEQKVVSCLGPLGELSAERLLSYIPKFGALTSSILKQLTADPANENTALIPDLSDGSKTYKDFKVIFNGPVENSSSVRSFKWLSTCDTTQMNIKQDLENAKEAVKTNITNRVENAKTNAQNVKTNVNKIIETQKEKVQTAKDDLEQTKADIQNAKDNAKENTENLKNLLLNAIKNSQNQMPQTEQTTAPEVSE